MKNCKVKRERLRKQSGRVQVERSPNSMNARSSIILQRPEEMGAEVRDAIDNLTKNCGICLRTAAKRKHFKISLGTEEIRFNNIVAADIMYLAANPVLHIVCETTDFQAVCFYKSGANAADTWKQLARFWLRTYLGPSEFLRVDQGTNFI
jgi:hypothetical protein